MKKLFFIFSLACLSFVACDVIEPFEDGTYIKAPELEIGGDTIESMILFEFTGWQCIGCPTGHEMIETIEETYGDRVHAIAIHAGFFADPGSDGPEFECDEGDAFLERFENPMQFPLGSINSMNSDELAEPTAWLSSVATTLGAINENPEVYIKMKDTIIDSEIIAAISLEFVQAINGECNVSLYVVENGIEGLQKHFQEGLIEDYIHQHVLRASMNNGIIGELAAENPEVGTTFEEEYIMKIDNEWEADSLHVIPFVYHVETNKVLLAKVIKLKNE